jgi:sulfur relay (sulfurtransferase) DsrC/TusE family protein
MTKLKMIRALSPDDVREETERWHLVQWLLRKAYYEMFDAIVPLRAMTQSIEEFHDAIDAHLDLIRDLGTGVPEIPAKRAQRGKKKGA